MFHISNFGSCSGALGYYADFEGYVPQPGDDRKLFHYVRRSHQDFKRIKNWKKWCEDASKAAEDAQEDIEDWRDQNH